MFHELEQRLGYTFQDKDFLQHALRHASAAKTPSESYERLEFLGDRVLGLVVADMLIKTFPDSREGGLAKRFSALVCERTLKNVADELDLSSLVIAEKPDFAKERPSVVADALEALIAVIYLEAGYSVAREIIEKLWRDRLLSLEDVPKDPKSALQEWTHLMAMPMPTYTLINRTGPDHRPFFYVKVQVGNDYESCGQGTSLRLAEKMAAQNLLQSLEGQKKEANS